MLVVLLELKKSVCEYAQGAEVVGGEDLALHDGEVDFNLVEPTGMDRQVHRDDGRPRLPEAPDTAAPRWDEPLSRIQNTRLASQ